MNSGKMIFSQLMDFLPSQEFRRCVDRYKGNYKLQRFSCWDQFLCMAFAQLTYRESLRDIEACLRSAGTKLYHMGIRNRVARNTLANDEMGATSMAARGLLRKRNRRRRRDLNRGWRFCSST